MRVWYPSLVTQVVVIILELKHHVQTHLIPFPYKILVVVLLVVVTLIAVSTGASMYKYVFLHEYNITLNVPCDPLLHSCFVSECDTSDQCEYYSTITAPAGLLDTCASDEGECVLEQCSTTNICHMEYCQEVLNDNEASCSEQS